MFKSGVKTSPEHLHFGAQLCHTVMLRLVDGEKGVAAAVGTLPAAEVAFGQVRLQTPPLYLHRTTWEHRDGEASREVTMCFIYMHFPKGNLVHRHAFKLETGVETVPKY